MEDKIEFIDNFLMRCEDWMHGDDGIDVTKCRKYLIEIREQVKNCSIPNVVGSALLSDLMKEQQEIINSPIRFNGVDIEKIKQVFDK